MTDFASVHAALDQATVTALAGIPLVYGNMSDETLSAGSVSFVKQRVVFTRSKQLQLGRVTPGRDFGSLVFLIHVRRGQGDADRNTILKKVVESFRSQLIGGATLLDARILNQGESANWALTAVEFPFYFHPT